MLMECLSWCKKHSDASRYSINVLRVNLFRSIAHHQLKWEIWTREQWGKYFFVSKFSFGAARRFSYKEEEGNFHEIYEIYAYFKNVILRRIFLTINGK